MISQNTIWFYLAQIIARRKLFWNLPSVSLLLFFSIDVTVKLAMRTTKRRAGNTASCHASHAPNRPMEDFPTLSNFRILRNILSSMLEPPLSWAQDHTYLDAKDNWTNLLFKSNKSQTMKVPQLVLSPPSGQLSSKYTRSKLNTLNLRSKLNTLNLRLNWRSCLWGRVSKGSNAVGRPN